MWSPCKRREFQVQPAPASVFSEVRWSLCAQPPLNNVYQEGAPIVQGIRTDSLTCPCVAARNSALACWSPVVISPDGNLYCRRRNLFGGIVRLPVARNKRGRSRRSLHCFWCSVSLEQLFHCPPWENRQQASFKAANFCPATSEIMLIRYCKRAQGAWTC